MILMYHHVSAAEDASEANEPNCHITPEALEGQILRLIDLGYRFVSVDSMVGEILQNGHVSPRTVSITLDDGWVDNYQYAFPVFTRHSVPATFFITTEHLNRRVLDEHKMTPAQIAEMHRYGMSIGGHTRTHADLLAIPLDQARDEIRGCKADIEDLLGAPVSLFAYPGGVFNRAIADLVEEAGYAAACSVIGMGLNRQHSLFWLHRDILSTEMNTFPDAIRLNGLLRFIFSVRTKRRVNLQLSTAFNFALGFVPDRIRRA